MVDYKGSEAYDFSLFEPQVVVPSASAGAPARKYPPKKAEIKTLPQRENRSAHHTSATELPAAVKKTIAFVSVCVVLIFALLFLQAQRDKLSSQISAAQSKLAIAQAENVRLNAAMSSKISTDKIEKYAEKKLGMVKAGNYQITYIDRSEGDKIVVSGDKEVGSGDSVLSKIKELIAYIF